MSAETLSSNWRDISVPVHAGLPTWPGDASPRMERVSAIAAGAECNVTHLSLSAHTGTHLDAPLHYLRDGAAIDAMPLDTTCGPARVVAIGDERVINAAELERHALTAGERVLFRTRNSARAWWQAPFDEGFVHLTVDAAAHLVACGVRVVGVDYLSVGGYEQDACGADVHRVLLGAGIWLIEGLDLSSIDAGRYELICLPLRLVGADGAPARAALRAADNRAV